MLHTFHLQNDNGLWFSGGDARKKPGLLAFNLVVQVQVKFKSTPNGEAKSDKMLKMVICRKIMVCGTLEDMPEKNWVAGPQANTE